ncbi:MAG: TonB-dependent receptor [Verrucomicrobia bacterium]|nr:TonB-dependent receptor [Verrucomicrobiota bacterium]
MRDVNNHSRWRRIAQVVITLLCAYPLGASEQERLADDDFTEHLMSLSLEELLDVHVEIASRTPQKVGDIPAAVSVITQADIQRSGATSIAEALRMGPGVDAAQISNNSWAVGIRGFNSYLVNKSLVMVDGRSAYAPLFAGTYWDSVDMVLDDVERIEIIRGPGAAVWGANTMNGVVNIISKNARDTQGTLVKAGYGSELQGMLALRHGVQVAEQAYLRVYGKYLNVDESVLTNGQPAHDDSESGKGGFRFDWEPTELTQVTLQGDMYGLRERNEFYVKPVGATGVVPVKDLMLIQGGNLLGRVTHELESGARLSLQGYHDRSDRDTVMVHDLQNVTDFDFTLSGPDKLSHQWIGGLGYRQIYDSVASPHATTLNYVLPHRTTRLFSAFIQDTVALIPDKWQLMVGSKFEHNSYTHFEFQPGARLQFNVSGDHMMWGSVTRAIRTPSRTDLDVTVDPGVPVPLLFHGNRDLEAETMFAYELGYRGNLRSCLSMDVAFFFNDYDRLITTGFPMMSSTGMSAGFVNGMEGETYGIELAPQLQLTDWWRLMVAYTLQFTDFETPAGYLATEPPEAPRHILNLQSRLDVSDSVKWDVIGRFVDERAIESSRLGRIVIPSYWALDVRLAWQPRPNLELAIMGKNLLTPSHPEFSEPYVAIQSTEIQRSVYGTLAWNF